MTKTTKLHTAEEINAMSLSDALKATNRKIPYRIAYTRMTRLGWSKYEAVTVELNSRKPGKEATQFVVINGEEYTLTEAAKKLNCSRGTLYHRLKNGWSAERAGSEAIHANEIDEEEEDVNDLLANSAI